MSVTTSDGCICAMGGFDGHIRQNTAEKYTPTKNQWSLIAPMTQQRSDASASTLDGEIYFSASENTRPLIVETLKFLYDLDMENESGREVS